MRKGEGSFCAWTSCSEGPQLPSYGCLEEWLCSAFIQALNRLHVHSKIFGAVCTPPLKAQKSVWPHANLSGLFGWLWRWTGLRQDQRAAQSTLPTARLCLRRHERDATRDSFAASGVGPVLIGQRDAAESQNVPPPPSPKCNKIKLLPLNFSSSTRMQTQRSGEAALEASIGTDELRSALAVAELALL